MVDARHILARLGDSREAIEQIAFADQIVLNKTDLADESALRAIERALRRINALAPVQRALRSQVPLQTVLGCGGFDLARIVLREPDFLPEFLPEFLPPAPNHEQGQDEHCGHDSHDHDPHHDPHHDHDHDASITSVSLTSLRAMDALRVQQWLSDLLAAQGDDILRTKGIVDVAGDERRLVLQAVHRVLEGDWQRPWRADEARQSRLVFIGRQLDAAALDASFQGCAACA